MNDDLKEDLLYSLCLAVLIMSVILSIAIPCLIGKKMNIEKELKMKELEVYGEYREEKNINE